MEAYRVKCSICKNKTIQVVRPTDLIENKKINWKGTGHNRNGKYYEFWYCPKHSVNEIVDFYKKELCDD